MGYSKSILAYGDCRDAMEKALAEVKGIRISFPDHKAATRFLQRCHYLRKLDRETNARLFPEAHELHSQSAYDTLFLRKDKENPCDVLMEIIKPLDVEIKPL